MGRLGTLLGEGVPFALHTDFSLVAVPMHPLTAAWVAINRFGVDGKAVLAPGERIDLDRTLRAITVDAAHMLGMERTTGSLEPGKHADCAILDEDPYQVSPTALHDISIWGTARSGMLHRTGGER